MADPDLDELLRDAAYTTIGFGLLAFQRLQVRRREIARAVQSARSAAEVPGEVLRWAVGLPGAASTPPRARPARDQPAGGFGASRQ